MFINIKRKLIVKKEMIIRIGGMGLDVSNRGFVNEIGRNGKKYNTIPTLTGTGAELVLAYTLENGDPGEHFRRALTNLPKAFRRVGEKIIKTYFVKNGIGRGAPHKPIPMMDFNPSIELINLIVCGNFCLGVLGKEEHKNPVSINYLKKIDLHFPYALFGIMLAEIDEVSIGAGLATQVPGILNSYARGEAVVYHCLVEGIYGAKTKSIPITFDPRKHFGLMPDLKRPNFLPIVSNHRVANIFLQKTTGEIYAFVAENNLAGGHNSNPFDKKLLDENGETMYGPKDETDYNEMRKLGVPFYLAGGFASPKKMAEAAEVGAIGVQVGTIGALANESNLRDDLKKYARHMGYLGKLIVIRDRKASPTGYGFMVAQIPDTLSDKQNLIEDERICDIGQLRVPYIRPDGKIIFNCSADNLDIFEHKGGNREMTIDKKCLCSGLCNTSDLLQNRKAIVTLSPELGFLRELMSNPDDSYSIIDALRYLRGLKKY